MVEKSHFLKYPLSRHIYYFLGYQLANIISHLIILSVIIFFHFLLDHRLADIQDWIFFHGWEVLILGKLLSLGGMSRFIGILSSERNPLLHILSGARGFFKLEVIVAIVFMTIALLVVGKPEFQIANKWSFYPLLISYLGHIALFGGDALFILVLNKAIPLKRRAWSFEVVLFSAISFLIHKVIFLFGIEWNAHIIFSFILIFYSLKLRSELVWLHSLTLTLLFVAPFFTLFGLDPLWGSRFSPFILSESVTGIAFAVFTSLAIAFFAGKKYKLISM